LALGFFVWRSRLFVNERIAVLVVTGKVIGRLSATGVTIDALIIDEKAARNVVCPFF
jgi:hypothetical protein